MGGWGGGGSVAGGKKEELGVKAAVRQNSMVLKRHLCRPSHL